MTLHDARARERIAKDLGTTFVVEAAAGTGKTTALVGRVVAVVREGHGTLGRIIAVTFTEKAAGEMKLRLRAALEKARADSQGVERERLERALSELEAARIGTIHALCADLLKEHPVEARVDPLFEMATEPESQALLDQAFETWLPVTLKETPEGVRRLLRRQPRRRNQSTPKELLRQAAWRLVEHRDFDAPWRRDAFDRDAELDALIPELEALAAFAARGTPDDFLAKNLTEIDRFVKDLKHREAVSPRDHDGLEASLHELARHNSWKWKGFRAEYAKGISRDELAGRRDALRERLKSVLERADADLAACLHRDVWPVVHGYEEAKAKAGRLDFFDLLVRLRALLVENAEVRATLQERFSHLFVDEFQDTDPIQADIVRLLASDDAAVSDPAKVRPVPGKLFIVGDPKQSIYRFRRADVALYERVKRHLLDAGAELLDLTTSFRAAPELQSLVNAAFAPNMVQDPTDPSPSQARYVPLTEHRRPIEGQPQVVALPIPRPYGDYGKVTNWAIDQSAPDAVGAFIEFLVQRSGWKVVETGVDGIAREVPVQPRHVCILFKRFRGYEGADVTLEYAKALEARGLPHVLVGGRSFHTREEVLALRNALKAIEWPQDELSVYATLRGPLFALSDDSLLVFKSKLGGLHPLRPLDVEKLSGAVKDVAEGLAVLRKLHVKRNRRPVSDTVSELLEAVRAHAAIAFWNAGAQALGNLAQLGNLARRFEASGGRSFRGFVEQLEKQAERGEVPEAPIVEEGSDGVRMMTVHAAKGLEFPVVILADPTAPRGRKDPTQWVDPDARLWAEPLAWCVPSELREHAEEAIRRDDEESVRLAYVAATRARDLLVVPAVGDVEQPGWLELLHPAIYPQDDQRRISEAAPGCPAFGDDTVIGRSSKQPVVALRPGLHKPKAGHHRVVWFDPKLFGEPKELEPGITHEGLLKDDGVNARESREAHDAWVLARTKLRVAGEKPSLKPIAATELEVKGVPVPLETTGQAGASRPHGKRFGALVHLALAEVPLVADAAQIARAVLHAARTLGCPDDERAAAERAVTAALVHPLWKRAAGASEVRREWPVMLPLEDGQLVEGVVDLAFKESAGWTVIDFKTDVELDSNREHYEAQVGLYAKAIGLATDAKASGVLLSV